MRSMLLAGGLASALALPSLAAAQTRCEREHQTNQVAGTVVGAGIGALLGSAVVGRKSGTEGAVIGGIAGAVAGNQLSRSAGQPCPAGYYEVPTSAPTPEAAAPPAFWTRAPAGVRERIDYLESRIRNGERDGALSRDEADTAYRDLADLRRTEMRLRRRDGGALNQADHDYLQARLDDVGRRVRWAERTNGYASGQDTRGYNNGQTYAAPAESYSPAYGRPDEANRSYSSPAYGNPAYTAPNDTNPNYASPNPSDRPYDRPSGGYYDSQGYWHAR